METLIMLQGFVKTIVPIHFVKVEIPIMEEYNLTLTRRVKIIACGQGIVQKNTFQVIVSSLSLREKYLKWRIVIHVRELEKKPWNPGSEIQTLNQS